MINFKIERLLIVSQIILIVFSLQLEANSILDSAAEFTKQRMKLLKIVNRNYGIANKVDREFLKSSIRDFRLSYDKLNRSLLDPFELYQLQFQLRMTNGLLKKYIDYEYKENRLNKKERSALYSEAHFLNKNGDKNFLSPKTNPPIEGPTDNSFPLSYWEKNKDFYNYTFVGDAVLFRGLLLKSGDAIFNYTTQRPVGIFTSVGEQQSVFPHVSMVIIFQTPKGRLPLVADVFKNGVRLIPLHHFLSDKLLLYSEIFRFKNPPANFESLLDAAGRKLVSQTRPYDLLGLSNRNALGCPELIDFVFELIDQSPFVLRDIIKDTIYQNVLKFGKFERKFLMPNDIMFDYRYQYVGYLDNTPPIKDIIINDLLVNYFRETMDKKSVKVKKGFILKFITQTVEKMSDAKTILGQLLLKTNGFNNDNFPVGDLGLIGAVGVVDLSFSSAMSSCTNPYNHSQKSECNIYLEKLLEGKISEEQLSILWWRNEGKLKALIQKEVSMFNNLFE